MASVQARERWQADQALTVTLLVCQPSAPLGLGDTESPGLGGTVAVCGPPPR